MNDRELLELAAKAFFNDGPTHISNEGFMDWVRDCRGAWNPLTDDGDALRLAVDLRFDVENNGHFASVVCADLEHPVMSECNDGDKYATTRRAIVRAAAQIGQSM